MKPDALEPLFARAFLLLLDLVISTIRHDPAYPPGPPSYNIILTLEHLYLIPRSAETHTLVKTGDELSINSLGFAGMLLVKSETELEAVKEEGVVKILRSVGLESVHDIQVAGTTAEAGEV
jgi:sulfate adenylyltransferase (ADP) / ATP adenylyltransferase